MCPAHPLMVLWMSAGTCAWAHHTWGCLHPLPSVLLDIQEPHGLWLTLALKYLWLTLEDTLRNETPGHVFHVWCCQALKSPLSSCGGSGRFLIHFGSFFCFPVEQALFSVHLHFSPYHMLPLCVLCVPSGKPVVFIACPVKEFIMFPLFCSGVQSLCH